MLIVAAPGSAGDWDGQAVLARWYKGDGERVETGESILELGIDNATVDMPAPSSGVLRHLKRAGGAVSFSDEIARIDPAN
jgi:2-oxoglutarate dehydrogenase E2 component (dihydrolipoamide succinyltransferase)